MENKKLKKQVLLNVQELEERIAPSATGNPGNNNPPANNTEMERKKRTNRILPMWEGSRKKISEKFRLNGLMSGAAVCMLLILTGTACEDGALLNVRQETSDLESASTVSSTDDSYGASLPHTNITELDMPVTVAYELTTYDCSNNPGPKITFSGLTTTAGFGVRTIFRNNMKGTHEHVEEANIDVTLMPDGSEITIPKQPVLGGTGGNPFIWIVFVNEEGEAVSDEIFIGRCVQGFSFKGAEQVAENATATTRYTVEGCENSPGPNITFDAGLSMAGLNARIIFRNNDNPVGGPHEAEADISQDLTVIPEGTSWTFPKQPVLGGVGGNPWIWTQFMDGSSETAFSEEILLGRCEQLSKAL